MIWMKVSLLALLYNSLDAAGKQSLLTAIFLALYSLVLILPSWAQLIWNVTSTRGCGREN